MSCISPQETYQKPIFENGIQIHEGNKLFAKEPSYRDIIPNGLLRRMSKIVRMSVATGMPLNKRNSPVDAIIIGSSNGSVEKSLRFLNQIIDYDEGTLTPTDFVQSTPNCVAGMLALMGKITGYNTTHVNQGLSFESAALDALLLFEENKAQRILLGAGEELSEANHNIESQRELFKKEEITNDKLLNSNTPGTLPGEGVSMFVVEKTASKEAFAQIVDVDMISHVTKEDIEAKTNQFLAKNGLKPEDIDTLFLGRNGDNRTDNFYDHLEQTTFPTQSIYVYKNLAGEYYSVSAFATWLAALYLKGTKLPKECLWKEGNKDAKYVLIYNNHEGKQHGFILLRSK